MDCYAPSFGLFVFRGLCLVSSLGGRTCVGFPVPDCSYFLAIPADGGFCPLKFSLQFPLPPPWVPPWVLGSPPAGSSAPLRPLVVSLSWFPWLRGGPPSMMGAVSVTCVENLPSFFVGGFSPFFFSYCIHLVPFTLFTSSSPLLLPSF